MTSEETNAGAWPELSHILQMELVEKLKVEQRQSCEAVGLTEQHDKKRQSVESVQTPHLPPHAVVPQWAGTRVAALGLGRFHPLIAVAVAAAVGVLADHHPPLEAPRTGAGALQGTE